MKSTKIYQPKVEMQKRKMKKKKKRERERNKILSVRKLCIECESELHIYNKRLEIK